MLKELGGVKRIVLATGYSDMRMGIEKMKARIMLEYGQNPVEKGTLFLFCGRRCDQFKGLIYEGYGFCMVTFRFSNGTFRWPRTPREAQDISKEEFLSFLSIRSFSITKENNP